MFLNPQVRHVQSTQQLGKIELLQLVKTGALPVSDPRAWRLLNHWHGSYIEGTPRRLKLHEKTIIHPRQSRYPTRPAWSTYELYNICHRPAKPNIWAYNVNECNEGPKSLLLKLRAASRLFAGKRKQISHKATMAYHCQWFTRTIVEQQLIVETCVESATFSFCTPMILNVTCNILHHTAVTCELQHLFNNLCFKCNFWTIMN